MSAIEFCIDTVRVACEMPEPANEAAAELQALREAVEASKEAIDLALNWGPKTQSDEYLIETRLKEALAKLEAKGA
jgi:hypothetical protein